MASLPIPADMYFQDFAFDLQNYSVKRNSVLIGSFDGLTNDDESGRHIAFKYGTDIQVGDILSGNIGRFIVKNIEVDTYQGKPELIKAYY